MLRPYIIDYASPFRGLKIHPSLRLPVCSQFIHLELSLILTSHYSIPLDDPVRHCESNYVVSKVIHH